MSPIISTPSGDGDGGGTSAIADTRSSRRVSLLACVVIILVSSLILTYEIDEPFWGIQDFNCVLQSIAARNFLKHGFLETRFMPATNTGDVQDGKFDFYVHHPPMIGHYLALFYWLLGESEWAGRLFFVLCTIGSSLLVFAIGRLHLRPLLAFLSALAFALFPCTGYFGRMINYESPGLFFALLAFWGYCLFLKSRSSKAIWLMYVANTLGLLVCWESYLLPFAIAFHYVLWGSRGHESRLRILLLPASTVVVFFVFLVYVMSLVGGLSGSGHGGSLDWILKLRMGTLIGVGKHFTFLEFLNMELLALKELFTPLAVYGAGAWLVLLVIGRIRGRRGRDHFDWLILSLFIYAITYLLIFRQPAYLHDYMVYYAGPAVAFAAVLAIRDLMSYCLAPKGWVKGAAAILLGYVFLVAGIPEFFELHRNPPDDRWIEFGNVLSRHIGSDEAVILSWTDRHYFTEYYSDREILRGVTTVKDFREAQQKAHNEVLFYMDTAKPRASVELLSLLESEYVRVPIRVSGDEYTAYILRIPKRYRQASGVVRCQ